jgi:hypothetical protein
LHNIVAMNAAEDVTRFLNMVRGAISETIKDTATRSVDTRQPKDVGGEVRFQESGFNIDAMARSQIGWL